MQNPAAQPYREFMVGDACRLTLRSGDITFERVDAIVNAANERMLGGMGVDGAIHAAAGRGLYEACLAIPEVTPDVRCPQGEARLTPAFRLPVRYVIHTVGPYYESPAQSAPALGRCYEACFELANQRGLASIAFPAISCGIFGYPPNEAAEVAVQSIERWHGGVRDVRIVLYGDTAYETWTSTISAAINDR
jgi:O-acetyl-ADP-ribose deacetylase (regulator of RNase III)